MIDSAPRFCAPAIFLPPAPLRAASATPTCARLLSEYLNNEPIVLFRRIKHLIIWTTTPRKDALRRARLQQLIAKTAQKRLQQ
jgi:hypothetical protein